MTFRDGTVDGRNGSYCHMSMPSTYPKKRVEEIEKIRHVVILLAGFGGSGIPK